MTTARDAPSTAECRVPSAECRVPSAECRAPRSWRAPCNIDVARRRCGRRSRVIGLEGIVMSDKSSSLSGHDLRQSAEQVRQIAEEARANAEARREAVAVRRSPEAMDDARTAERQEQLAEA